MYTNFTPNISGQADGLSHSPQVIEEVQQGVGTQSVHVIGDKYTIDIYGDMLSYKPKDTALLTILEGLGSQSINAPYDVWSDDYNGDMWVDLKLDNLRLNAMNGKLNNNDANGALIWKKVVSNAFVEAVTATASSSTIGLYFVEPDDKIVGKKEYVWRAIANALDALGYDPIDNSGAAATGGNQSGYVRGTGAMPLYLAFEDFAFHETSPIQTHEIVVAIKKFRWGTAAIADESGISNTDGIYIELDFTDSNVPNEFSATSEVLFAEIPNSGNFYDNVEGTALAYSHVSRMGLIGNNQEPADGIPEGSNFTEGSGFNYSVESHQNKTQIFDTPKYGITGTRQASNARFFDEFQKSRVRHLAIYKRKQNGTFLRGIQSEKYTAAGLKRTCSGILDYAQFPIRYMRSPMPVVSSTDSGLSLMQWINDITYSLQAFRNTDGSSVFTVLCSQNVLNNLSITNAIISTSPSNVTGIVVREVKPSKMTLGLQVFEYVGPYGTLRFIHEPAFDLMPRLKASENSTSTTVKGGIPAHLFPNGLDPRNILMVLDKAFIRKTTLRPDKIYGNIQNPGQDIFQEAMRGEHSIRMRFPKNHAIIDVTP